VLKLELRGCVIFYSSFTSIKERANRPFVVSGGLFLEGCFWRVVSGGLFLEGCFWRVVSESDNS
jgi:hypothetical protein